MKIALKYKFILGLGTFILLLQMWLNSGNMSVYAATLSNPHTMKGYITNYDDVHYYMNYKMICGAPSEEWKVGYTLRRVGLFLIGYPFFRLFGFYWGGEITSFLLVLFSFIYLAHFIKQRYGLTAAYAAILLGSSYTGIMYWIGSPFAQNTIFPICVFSYIIMTKLTEAITLKRAIGLWFLLGLLYTGYDLFIIFLPAVFFYYLLQRKWLWAVLSAPIIFSPQVLVEIILHYLGALTHNDNKDLYLLILSSWFTNFSFGGLLVHIKELPYIFYRNILDSSFIVLPILFSIVFILARWLYKFKFSIIETSILLGIFWLFLFLNLAPDYEHHFQLRGIAMARIYQPIFIIMIMYMVRFAGYLYEHRTQSIPYVFSLLIISFTICFWLNIGGWYRNTSTQEMYRNFYHHSDDDAYLKNIEQYGKRPLGF